jgi:hypothetical protein
MEPVGGVRWKAGLKESEFVLMAESLIALLMFSEVRSQLCPFRTDELIVIKKTRKSFFIISSFNYTLNFKNYNIVPGL